jgi:aspartyl-tRNA(Asn)/glutamyl-tRNA(Gln) amidotransferase subunit A
MTRCAQDAADVMNIISGHDVKDSTTMKSPLSFNIDLKGEIKGLKMAVPEEMLDYPGLEDGVKASFMDAVEELKRAGAVVEKISIPSVKYAVATYYLIAPAEASSNLSRFDGIRFGPRHEATGYDELVSRNRDLGFGREVKRRILLGTFTLSATYYDAYYRKALRTRRLMANELKAVLTEFDFILNPSSPVVPPVIGEISDPLSYYLMDIYTIPANVAGLPSISVPIAPVGGLPAGMLLTGGRFSDVKLLEAASFIEGFSPAYEDGLTRIAERWVE